MKKIPKIIVIGKISGKIDAQQVARGDVVVSLSDGQLKTVMDMARLLPVEKRDLYLQRIAAMLALRGRYGDDDVMQIATLALTGLAHQPAA